MWKWTILLAAVALSAGCRSTLPKCERDYQALVGQGAKTFQPYSPLAAELMSFVPSGVSYYLDEEEEHEGRPRPVLRGLALYPFYLVYDLVTAASRARNRNVVATVRYYRDGPGRDLYPLEGE